MIQLRQVSILLVSIAIAVNSAFIDEAANNNVAEASLSVEQENEINSDLIEADADFERLLGGTSFHYDDYEGSYLRGIKGSKGEFYGAKGGKGSKVGYYGDDDDDSYYGAKGGKGSKGGYGFYDEAEYHGGKGSQGRILYLQ